MRGRKRGDAVAVTVDFEMHPMPREGTETRDDNDTYISLRKCVAMPREGTETFHARNVSLVHMECILCPVRGRKLIRLMRSYDCLNASYAP